MAGEKAVRRKRANDDWDDVPPAAAAAEPAPDARAAGHEDARKRSRKVYLKRRNDAKLQELEAALRRYEARDTLTQQEQQDYEYKRKILDVLKKDDQQDAAEYELPQDYINAKGQVDTQRKFDALNAKPSHGEARKERYDQWENSQLRKAQSLIKSNTDEITIDSKEYEYVFDESQFVEYDTQEAPVDAQEEVQDHSGSAAASIDEVRRSLPVFKYRDQFLQLVRDHQVLIVVGETGSGKTTQLPQYLYEAGYCTKDGRTVKVGCTQPRRVAATSVAARVADEMGTPLGRKVGYSVRFDDTSSPETAIKYVTDGMLLREFLGDPLLSNYSALMIDEAHERTISTEIVLSLLKDIIRERTDLKLIIASATINAEKFSDFFDKAPIFKIPGRRFPVDIHFTKQPEANYLQAAMNTIFLIHTKKRRGDILVFLTGQDEIETMQENLLEAKEKLGSAVDELLVCSIYANLPAELQRKIFEPTPPNARKVVLATNIAETSITIDGISYVIDSGYVKENVFSPSTGMESLVVVPCSKASADQRAGRAGRVGPGECFRLYTKWSFENELASNPTPEILRGNLISVVLLLLSLGINDLVNFEFMDRPSSEALIKCLELLYALGALNSKGGLTTTGRRMSEFPIHPMFSKCLIESSKYGVTDDVLAIVSMLGESGSLFYRPKDKKELADKRKEAFHQNEGDHLTLLTIWDQWVDTEYSSLWCQDNFVQYKTLKRVRDVRDQLSKLCEKAGVLLENEEHGDFDHNQKTTLIQKAIVSGFFPNIAKLSKMGDSYQTLKKKQNVYIHPSSTLFPVKPPPKLVLYHELVLTSREYMRNCMIVEDKWIQEVAPHYYSDRERDQAGKAKRM